MIQLRKRRGKSPGEGGLAVGTTAQSGSRQRLYDSEEEQFQLEVHTSGEITGQSA
jgi:hypothetical protein